MILSWNSPLDGLDVLTRMNRPFFSSRGIIAAYKQEAYAKFGPENFGDASRAAVEAMVADISGVLAAAK